MGAEKTEYKITAVSGITAIEAGYGLLHADTIVATTTDELIISPNHLEIQLTVCEKTTNRRIADLGLDLGIYDAILSVRENKTMLAIKNIKLILAPPSNIRRKFGARYGSLRYDHDVIISKQGSTATWGSLWKTGEVSDIVVDFESGYKFLFWKGMSYAPSWAADNIMTSLFFAETVEPGVYRDCCEMMSDRECRYSHARIIQNSDARVIVHWRCALADSAYNICRNQWADELFYIYPDGTVCRNVTIYIDPNDERAWKDCEKTGKRMPVSMLDNIPGKRTFNDMEFIAVNPMGSASEDNLAPEALTILDCGNFRQTCEWPEPPDFSKTPAPELSEYIFKINYKNRPSVFVASHAENMKISLMGNAGMIYEAGAVVEDDCWKTVSDVPSMFGNFIHWPLTRGYGTSALMNRDYFNDRPTHTFLGHANNAPVEVGDNGAVTWIWLTGIADDDEHEMREKVKAWLNPVSINDAVYDRKQRAYIVDNAAGKDEVELEVTQDDEVAKPSFVICGWESEQISVYANNTELNHDIFSAGVERYMDKIYTVVTLKKNLPGGSQVIIRK